jgi:hypothetical protein
MDCPEHRVSSLAGSLPVLWSFGYLPKA